MPKHQVNSASVMMAQPVDPGKLRQRIIMGAFLLAVATLCIWIGGWAWTLVLYAVFYQGFRELYNIFKAKGVVASKVSVFLVGTVIILLAKLGLIEFMMPCVAIGVIVSFIRLLFRQPPQYEHPATINDMGATLLAIFYLGFLPMHYIMLRQLAPVQPLNLPFEPGVYYVFFTCLVISASDIGAYFVGKFFGRHPLYPLISPKKTFEGALGGLVFACIAGLGFMLTGQFSWWQALILSILLNLVSLLGDLTESLMKRDAGVKDSGDILMGHGGFLDRFDSYLFCGVLSYYYIHWFILHQGLAQNVIDFF